MGYFRTCPNCGCHLDPNERCDCYEDKLGEHTRRTEHDSERERAQAETLEAANAEMPRNLHPVRA